MRTLRYRVADTQNDDYLKDLVEIFDTLGLRTTGRSGNCDIILAHRTTDFLRQAERDSFLRAGGLYVEYTGGGAPWKVLDTGRYYFGSFYELTRRLRQLTPPVTKKALVLVLDFVPRPIELLAAVTLLSQGFLAVQHSAGALDSKDTAIKMALEHMGWPLPADHPGRLLLRDDLAGQLPAVRSAEWWRKVLPDASSADRVRQEWGAAPLRELDELLKTIEERETVDDAAIVAKVYLALVHRLEHES